MKRNLPCLAAACAELARFAALMLLAGDFGALDAAAGFPRLLRYVAAPQLLFAAGFFFLWLDAERYHRYRPLLLIGKLASLASLAPLASEILYSRFEHSARMRDPRAAFVHAAILVAVDIGSLAVLLLRAVPEARAPADVGHATLVSHESDLPAGRVAAGQDAAERVELAIPPAGENTGKAGG